MNKTSLTLLVLFLVLIPAQALVFNNLVLFDVAVPFVFIYMLITLPVTFSANLAMTIGFVTGLTVDILSDTAGVSALASTILTFVRRPVFHLYMPIDNDLAEQRPSLRNMGVAAFLKYAVTMSLIYSMTVFLIEGAGCFILKLFVMRTLASAVYTFIMIYAFACLTVSRHEKRL